ncbi:hypothetical protein LCGC14_2443890 [marine sediment metagenome]|uniref:Uncharacterized protein n=1 Tax=marine sediment metagenome TaxID=412755 RepID=A0A0F9EC46_9ZZZZ
MGEIHVVGIGGAATDHFVVDPDPQQPAYTACGLLLDARWGRRRATTLEGLKEQPSRRWCCKNCLRRLGVKEA